MNLKMDTLGEPEAEIRERQPDGLYGRFPLSGSASFLVCPTSSQTIKKMGTESKNGQSFENYGKLLKMIRICAKFRRLWEILKMIQNL